MPSAADDSVTGDSSSGGGGDAPPTDQSTTHATSGHQGSLASGDVALGDASSGGGGGGGGGGGSGGSSSSGKALARVTSDPIPGVKQAVVETFGSFSTRLEAYTPFMYTDIKGLVTTGIGNLIDPIGSALALPWKNADGSLASQDDIASAWHTVKNAHPGVQSLACARLTTIRLDKEGIAKLVRVHFIGDHDVLKKQYPGYESWPADAQLALHSLAWNWGPGFATTKKWRENGIGPQFIAEANHAKPDFKLMGELMMSASKHEESINPGIIPRDKANVLLFQNAADVQAKGGDYERLYYPGTFSAPSPASGGGSSGGGSMLKVLLGIIALGIVAPTAIAFWKHHGEVLA